MEFSDPTLLEESFKSSWKSALSRAGEPSLPCEELPCSQSRRRCLLFQLNKHEGIRDGGQTQKLQGLCPLTPLKPVSVEVQCRQPCRAGLQIKTPPGTGTAPPPRAARPSAWPPSVRKFFPISNRNLPWCNSRPLEVIQKSKHQGAEWLGSVHQKLFPPAGLLRRSCLHTGTFCTKPLSLPFSFLSFFPSSRGATLVSC